MGNLERLKQNILNAYHNDEMKLDYIEFNKRDNEVTMIYVYQSYDPVEIHTAPHVNDPELIDLTTLDQLKQFLDDKNIRYEERNDAFI